MTNLQQGITVQVYQARFIIGEVEKPLTRSIAVQFPVIYNPVHSLLELQEELEIWPYGKVLGSVLNAGKGLKHSQTNYGSYWFLLIDHLTDGSLAWIFYDYDRDWVRRRFGAPSDYCEQEKKLLAAIPTLIL